MSCVAMAMALGMHPIPANLTLSNVLRRFLHPTPACCTCLGRVCCVAQLAALKDKEDMLRADGLDTSAAAQATGSYADGAAGTSRKAAEMVDVLSDKVGALVRDFQQKTLEISRDDPDFFVRLVRVQGWFLEGLERRINACRYALRCLECSEVARPSAHRCMLLMLERC